jgi:hypothetical protein
VVTASNEVGFAMATTEVTIVKPTGVLSVQPSAPTGCAGWHHGFLISYQNISAIALDDVSIEAMPPAKTLVVYGESTSELKQRPGGGVRWRLGTVQSGETVHRTLVLQFYSSIPNETTMTLPVEALAPQSDDLYGEAAVEVHTDGICAGPTPTRYPTPAPPVNELYLPLVMRG